MNGTVLLVEDNPDNTTIYRVILEHAGLRVLHAEDGVEGVRLARELRPDLILMDIGLPGLNGLEATRILKGDPATAGIPIIAVTAHALVQDRVEALNAGCDAYLSKPAEPRRVLEEVRRWMPDGRPG